MYLLLGKFNIFRVQYQNFEKLIVFMEKIDYIQNYLKFSHHVIMVYNFNSQNHKSAQL